MAESIQPYPYTVEIEVAFRDLDAMGHVDNAVYLTVENPPQAAALKGEPLGGFVLGLSQDEDNHVFIVYSFLLPKTLFCGTLVLSAHPLARA